MTRRDDFCSPSCPWCWDVRRERWRQFRQVMVWLGVVCLLLCAALVGLFGCASSPERHSSDEGGYPGYRGNITSYRVTPDRRTPGGILVDDQSHLLADDRIDAMTDAVEACLARSPDAWTPAQIIAGHCLGPETRHSVRRDWFDVKVPPDWYVSPCTSEQLFPCDVDQDLCMTQKPELGEWSEREDCPCACRGTVQGNRTIVTTPAAPLFKATLVKLVTGCYQPWAIEELRPCL